MHLDILTPVYKATRVKFAMYESLNDGSIYIASKFPVRQSSQHICVIPLRVATLQIKLNFYSISSLFSAGYLR